MRKLPKVLLILTLSLTLILGSTLTVVCATATQTNPKTTGVQIVGNTMMVYGNNHNFYVWGKSVLAQCSGFSDILPNNNTKFVDIQFDGNLYKGLEEVIIVNQNNKNDKVVLEEGSMIITGVKNLEQLSTIRNAVAANPKNLAELKNNMALNSNELGLDKGFTVTKNGIADENGKSVKVQDIAGAVELVTIKEVNEAIEKEVNNTPEKKPEQVTKKVSETPSPKPTVKPSPTPCTEHQYSDGTHMYVSCINCDNTNPKCAGCTHNWDETNGQCIVCGCYCVHKYPAGRTGEACTVCGYNPSARPVPSAVPICPHTFGFEDVSSDEFHRCKGCWDTFSHNYDVEGHCEECGHTCNHGGATTGTCSYCGVVLTPACQVDHSQYCTDWECDCGEYGTREHHYELGVCIYCNANCPVCGNDVDRLGEEEGKVGNRCPFCGFEGL